jgi:aspartyl-tRNA(Asn)/glutamyl-tRNA(Gln) amidotransferase subunit A
MDHVGPMARSAADCALVLGAMAGFDAADPTTSALPVPDYTAALGRDVKGLRIGLLRGVFAEGLLPDLRAALDQAVRQLEGLGAIVDEVTLRQAVHVPAASLAVVAAEALAYHAEFMRTRPQDYQPDVRERLFGGAFVSGVHYLRAQQIRALVRAEVDEALAQRDVLLAPSTAIAATPLGAREVTIDGVPVDVRGSLLKLTRPFNFSGHPSCAVPCGFTGDGLPLGMQIVGRPFDEMTVLRVADVWQRATDWHARRPPLGTGPRP